MFITPAYAQTGAEAGYFNILFIALIFLIIYMLMIRPQQRRAKEHREMVANLRRGDDVTLSGGIKGKVTKVDDEDAIVEIAQDVRVKVIKSTIADVNAKGEPATQAPEDTKKKDDKKK